MRDVWCSTNTNKDRKMTRAVDIISRNKIAIISNRACMLANQNNVDTNEK